VNARVAKTADFAFQVGFAAALWATQFRMARDRVGGPMFVLVSLALFFMIRDAWRRWRVEKEDERARHALLTSAYVGRQAAVLGAIVLLYFGKSMGVQATIMILLGLLLVPDLLMRAALGYKPAAADGVEKPAWEAAASRVTTAALVGFTILIFGYLAWILLADRGFDDHFGWGTETDPAKREEKMRRAGVPVSPAGERSHVLEGSSEPKK
jgi:hypothetical protein